MAGAIEIAGLALAGFSLLLSVMKHYEDAYRRIDNYIHFRDELARIHFELCGQQLAFRQHVELMLCSVASSRLHLSEMMADTTSDMWQNEELTLNLKKKLCGDGEYDQYQATVNKIFRGLESMSSKLESMSRKLERYGLQDDNADRAWHSVQREFRKMQLVARKKHWEQRLFDLAKHTERCDKIFRNAESLATARQSKVSPAMQRQTLKQTQIHASRLHKAILSGWKCACKYPHSSRLLVAIPPKADVHQDSPSRPMTISFSIKYLSPLVKAFVVDSEVEAWYTFEARMISHDTQTQTHSGGAGNSQSSYVDCTVSDRLGTATSTTLSSSGVSTTSTALATSSFSAMIRHSSSQAPILGRGNVASAIASPEHRGPLLTHDICHTLLDKAKDPWYLDDGPGYYHEFSTNPSVSPKSADFTQVISLRMMLVKEAALGHKQQSLELSRRTRMSIALALAYAVLELYPTPWMHSSLEKADIYFFQRETGQIMTDSPLFLCDVLPANPEARAELQEHAGNHRHNSQVLLSLGILIMELWYGEPIEFQPCYRELCDDRRNEQGLTASRRMSVRHMSAIKWHKDILGDGGTTLHEVTWWCIGGISEASVRLDAEKWSEAVYDKIVRPLEDMLHVHFSI